MLQRVQQAWTFPEDPVEPGETWEVSLPLIPGGEEKDIVFQMKFEGEEEMGDKRYWKLSAKDSVPIRVDLGAQGNDAGSMTVRGDIEIKMQLLFERSGRLFSQLSEMRSDLTIDYSRATGKMKVVEDTVSRWTSLNRPKSTKGA
jgi:hypothetical protein